VHALDLVVPRRTKPNFVITRFEVTASSVENE
jgi:hypothetical protein